MNKQEHMERFTGKLIRMIAETPKVPEDKLAITILAEEVAELRVQLDALMLEKLSRGDNDNVLEEAKHSVL